MADRGHIFISYASADAAVADRIRVGLEQNGLRCWIAPRDIEPGTSFPAAITAAAGSCAALVLLLTGTANESPHVLSEVELAFNARKPILAVLVGKVTPSANLQYFISTTHWFDAESSFDDEDLSRLQVDLEKLLAGERVRLDRDRHRVRLRQVALLAMVVLAIGAVLYGVFRPRASPVPAITPAASPSATSPSAAPPDRSTVSGGPATAPPAKEATSPAAPSPRTKTNAADGQTYVWIPPGRFSMGCSPGDGACEPDEMPTHAVRIRSGFWLASTEVTVAQYARRNRESVAAKDKPANTPVTDVDRNEAKTYCTAVGGRLPTEAEWEYAARGGTSERYYDTLSESGWYDDNSGDHSHPVGGKAANPFGLYDMLGNVYEWVLDRYYNKYDDTDGPVEEPLAPNASGVARGGAWTSGANDVRVSNRLALPPDAAEGNVGFRCALSGP